MSRKKKPTGRKVLFNNERNVQDYRRRKNIRQPRKIILILCEGSQTEPNYFRALRQHKRLQRLRVEVIPGGEDRVTPVHLIDMVGSYIRDLDWDSQRDEAWCVFDYVRPEEQASFQRAVDLAHHRNIHLAVSNPAFEFWFLIHFDHSDRPFLDVDELIRVLCTHIPHYEKNMQVFQTLKDHTDEALAYCGNLRKRAEQGWDNFPNPSTGVDLLVHTLWVENA